MTIDELRQAWIQRRDEWRRLGVQVDGAKLCDELLRDLDQLAAQDADELLTLTDAAREANLHPDSIGRAIRQGRIQNAGRPNAPRVRRGDLDALKAGRRSAGADARPAASLPGIARAAIAAKLPRITRG